MKGSTNNLMVMGGRGLHLESFHRTNGFLSEISNDGVIDKKEDQYQFKGGPFQKCAS